MLSRLKRTLFPVEGEDPSTALPAVESPPESWALSEEALDEIEQARRDLMLAVLEAMDSPEATSRPAPPAEEAGPLAESEAAESETAAAPADAVLVECIDCAGPHPDRWCGRPDKAEPHPVNGWYPDDGAMIQHILTNAPNGTMEPYVAGTSIQTDAILDQSLEQSSSGEAIRTGGIDPQDRPDDDERAPASTGRFDTELLGDIMSEIVRHDIAVHRHRFAGG